MKNLRNINHVIIEGYNPYYSKKNQTITLIKQLPKFIKTIILEKSKPKKWSNNYKIDIIISDNRFGFRSKNNKFLIHIK